MKLTKNVNPKKYGYSTYGNGLHARPQFSFSIGEWGKNVVTFGADSSS